MPSRTGPAGRASSPATTRTRRGTAAHWPVARSAATVSCVFLQNVLDIISHWTWPQHSGGELPWVLTEVIARVGQDRAGMPSSRSEGKAGYDPSHEDWHRRSRPRADSSHPHPLAHPDRDRYHEDHPTMPVLGH